MDDSYTRDILLATFASLLDSMPVGASLLFTKGDNDGYMVMPVSPDNAVPIIGQYLQSEVN